MIFTIDNPWAIPMLCVTAFAISVVAGFVAMQWISAWHDVRTKENGADLEDIQAQILIEKSRAENVDRQCGKMEDGDCF